MGVPEDSVACEGRLEAFTVLRLQNHARPSIMVSGCRGKKGAIIQSCPQLQESASEEGERQQQYFIAVIARLEQCDLASRRLFWWKQARFPQRRFRVYRLGQSPLNCVGDFP